MTRSVMPCVLSPVSLCLFFIGSEPTWPCPEVLFEGIRHLCCLKIDRMAIQSLKIEIVLLAHFLFSDLLSFLTCVPFKCLPALM